MNTLLKVKGTYTLPYAIKAEWAGHMIFSILFIPISLLWIVVAYKNQSQNFLLPILIPWIILTIFLVWLASFKIILRTGSIFYKTLFSKGKEIPYTNIKNVEIDIGLFPSGSGLCERASRRGFYRLNLFRHAIEEPVTINMKPFSKRDLAIIVDRITVANPSVGLDELSQSLKDGDFGPIVKAGIRKVWQVALYIFWLFLTLNLVRHFLK